MAFSACRDDSNASGFEGGRANNTQTDTSTHASGNTNTNATPSTGTSTDSSATGMGTTTDTDAHASSSSVCGTTEALFPSRVTNCGIGAQTMSKSFFAYPDDYTIVGYKKNEGHYDYDVILKPCLLTKCDSAFLYVASNGLPHYNPTPTTPNGIAAQAHLWKIPKSPAVLTAADVGSDFDDASKFAPGAPASNCTLVPANPVWVHTTEPAGYCYAGSGSRYIKEEDAYYHKISCLGAVGVVINGVPVYGPNEATRPSPFGNPAFPVPVSFAQAGATFEDNKGVVLDFCQGHTGGKANMHYHGLYEACYPATAKSAPETFGYATAVSNWSQEDYLTADCTGPSAILGWALDGVPIKGPCVQTGNDTFKRARSGWYYSGLKAWNSSVETLSDELKACTNSSDCDGIYECTYVVAKTSTGREVAKKCAHKNYSWCSHTFETAQAAGPDSFVYLDRCNGVTDSDGNYAYHVTGSFPHVLGCYSRAPDTSAMGGGGGNQGGSGGG
ncbi:MAG: YHYH protein [Myxococcota bacterium]|nr:YHYH protein [Myxococcota bacterium]